MQIKIVAVLRNILGPATNYPLVGSAGLVIDSHAWNWMQIWNFWSSERNSEALQGGFGERGEWGKNGQGAGSMASKKPGSKEQKKLI